MEDAELMTWMFDKLSEKCWALTINEKATY